MASPFKTRAELRRGKVRITRFARGNRGAPYILDFVDVDSPTIKAAVKTIQAAEFLGQPSLPIE